MSSNITYLIGAGASRNALPLVKDFKDKSEHNPLLKFIAWLENTGILVNQSNDHELKLLIERQRLNAQLIKETKEVLKNSMAHETIDTYAKKLYITRGQNSDELLKVKRVLSAFFIKEQYSKSVDIRYDTFFASITSLDENLKLKLPDKIKIISWNYDFQFEKGFLPYLQGADTIGETHSHLNSYPKIEGPTDFKIDCNRFGLVRLNGIAGFFSHDNHVKHILPKFTLDNQLLKIAVLDIYSEYLKYSSNFSNLFCFAWENNHIAKKAIENALEVAKNTDVLIIIGYSFPFFNREIDKKILNAMKPSKIFYQVPLKEDYDNYVDRLRGIVQHPLLGLHDKEEDYLASEGYYFPKPKHIGDEYQFFIPYEL